MHGDEDRLLCRRGAPVEHRLDGGMERGVEVRDAAGPLIAAEVAITRNFGGFADQWNEVGSIVRAVAVDDQPRHRRVHHGRIEQLAQPQRDAEGARIPGNVADAVGRRQAKVAMARRNSVGGMIANDCERALSLRIHGPDRRNKIRVVTRRLCVVHTTPDTGGDARARSGHASNALRGRSFAQLIRFF